MNRQAKLIKYTFTRLCLAPVMLWLIATMVFLMLRIAPGDPVDAILGNRASDEARDDLRMKLGLNLPINIQYINFINNLIHANFGEALVNQEPVSKIIYNSLPASIELAVCSLLIAILLGTIVGFSGIAKSEGKTDLLGRIYGIGTYALPPFWAAMVFQLIFAVTLGWLPVGGRFPPGLLQPEGTGFLILDSIINNDFLALQGAIRHLALPSITLGVLLSGVFSRALRINLSAQLKKDYIEAARSRGVSEYNLIVKHALPNSLLPVLTIAGITIASLIGGALLIEVTFSWPGIALRLKDAISQRDYPVVQGIVVVIAGLVVLITLLVDLIVAAIDPRVNY